jgi:hypothetical protein
MTRSHHPAPADSYDRRPLSVIGQDAGLELRLRTAVPGIYSGYIWKNIAIVLWFAPANLETLPIFEESCKALVREHPEGLSAVSIIVPGGRGLPDPQVRRELARIMSDNVDRFAAMAVLLPGTGFWASTMRGMLTALSMLVRQPHRMQIFGTYSEVVKWLLPLHTARTNTHIDAVQLRAVLRIVEAECELAASAA